MVTPDAVARLLGRHILWPEESLEAVHDLGDGTIGVETRWRQFAVESQRDEWAVGWADDIADVIVATRLDLLIHGQPERFAVVVLADGTEVYANEPSALAAFGSRVPDRLDPSAFAELLVQLHPYSSATRAVLVETDALRYGYGRADLPDVDPLRVETTPDGVQLRFCSSIAYRTPLAGPRLDVAAWTVTVPADAPASWETHLIHERIPLEAVTHDVR
jgi:hypothetical protein